MRRNKVKNYLSGFTVIEFLVVVVIIGLLVAAISLSYISAKTRGNCARVKEDLDAIAQAARLDQISTGVWAPTILTPSPGNYPAFVPKYLNQWPDPKYWSKTANYSWFNGDGVVNRLINSTFAFLSDQSGPGRSVPLYSHCIEDRRSGANPPNCVSASTYSAAKVLNFGDVCP